MNFENVKQIENQTNTCINSILTCDTDKVNETILLDIFNRKVNASSMNKMMKNDIDGSIHLFCGLYYKYRSCYDNYNNFLYNNAKKCYKNAIKKFKKGYHLLANLYLWDYVIHPSNISKAKMILLEGINNDCPYSMEYLGDLCFILDDMKNALKYYTMYMEKTNVNVSVKLGLYYHYNNNYAEAKPHLMNCSAYCSKANMIDFVYIYYRKNIGASKKFSMLELYYHYGIDNGCDDIKIYKDRLKLSKIEKCKMCQKMCECMPIVDDNFCNECYIKKIRSKYI